MVKKLWEITKPRKSTKVMSLGQGKKLRSPNSIIVVEGVHHFYVFRTFLIWITELLLSDSQYHHIAKSARQRITDSYNSVYEIDLNIPW